MKYKIKFNQLSFLILLIISLKPLYGQKFEYREVRNTPSFLEEFREGYERDQLLKKHNFIDATLYLPKNHVKDGTMDYTSFLQKALAENRYIKMPNFPILINDSGLDFKSHSIVVFDSKSLLMLQASSKKNYQILRIYEGENILIFSPKVKGDRYSHLTSDGEWGMGIALDASKNISIINPMISNCWGDGIYLGQHGQKTNENISITYGMLDNNRRNAISVISVNGLNISNIILSNTNGTNPQAGIDFEPNKNSDQLDGISINNLYTYNNKNQGVFFAIGNLTGSPNEINITIDTHFDEYSQRSIGFHYLKKKSFDLQLKGNIKLLNIDSKNSRHPLFIFKGSHKDRIEFNIKPLKPALYKDLRFEFEDGTIKI